MGPEIQLSPGKDRLTKWMFRWAAHPYAWAVGQGPEKELRAELLRFVGLRAEDRILDVGCGPGHLIEAAAPRVALAYGVDRSARMIRLARKTMKRAGFQNTWFHICDANSIPLHERSFDTVFSTAVLYLLQDNQTALREMIRLVKPGGTIACFNPSEKMTPQNMKRWCRENRCSAIDTFRMMAWARGAQIYRKWSATRWCAFFESAELENVETEERIAGQVVFVKGKH